MVVRLVSIAVSIGVLAAVLAWWARPAPPSAEPGSPSAPTPTAPAAPAEIASDAPAAPQPAPFRERLRAFLAAAPRLNPTDRQARADALRADILARERDGALLPAESAYLQLALLRATTDDEARLRARSQALLDAYQQRSAAGWARYRDAPDPRHEAYRAAEAELVERAAEQSLSPDELRERLQALREAYYANEALR